MTPAGKRLLDDLTATRVSKPTDEASILAIEAEAEVEGFRQGLEHAKATYVLDAFAAERARALPVIEAAREGMDALVWASGSSDFAPEGTAHGGWEAVGRPAIAALRAALDKWEKGK